jgi:hypothetical protein
MESNALAYSDYKVTSLTENNMCESVNITANSEIYEMLSSVQQGSILGQLLFLIYMDDFVKSLNMILFADTKNSISSGNILTETVTTPKRELLSY